LPTSPIEADSSAEATFIEPERICPSLASQHCGNDATLDDARAPTREHLNGTCSFAGLSQLTVCWYFDLFQIFVSGNFIRGWRFRTVFVLKITSAIVAPVSNVQSGLLSHPKSGSSWEGFVIEETVKLVEPDEAYFWATHTGAELDLLLIKNGQRIGVEVKRQDAPRLTPSMRIALDNLRLDHLVIVYPGSREYDLADGVRVVPLVALAMGDPEVLVRARSRTRPRKRRAGS
jgi:hypothetical protein